MLHFNNRKKEELVGEKDNLEQQGKDFWTQTLLASTSFINYVLGTNDTVQK